MSSATGITAEAATDFAAWAARVVVSTTEGRFLEVAATWSRQAAFERPPRKQRRNTHVATRHHTEEPLPAGR